MPDATTQVCGEFHDRTQLDEAMSRLEGSRFQRAELSVRLPGEAASNPVREDDARNLRTLGTSTAAAAAAMAAAGVVVATGGAALPAVAAAVAAGGVAAAAGEAVGQVAAPSGQPEAHRAAQEAQGVVLLAHAPSAEMQAQAEQVMRECGATRVWREDSAA